MNNKLLSMLLAATALSSASAVQAFNNGDVITFKAGVTTISTYGGSQVKSGSYFAMDTNGDGQFTSEERLAISVGSDGGIVIGSIQTASGSHPGPPDGSEIAPIDAPWSFFGNTGMHQTTGIPVVDNGNNTLDFRGWGVTWNGITIPLGGDINLPADTGLATVSCANVPCNTGDDFVVDYTAHVPLGDPSGFGGVGYQLHLESDIPLPPSASISMDVVGGSTQECSATGGSAISINATSAVPDGDAVASVDWMIDDVFAGNGLSINSFFALGSHSVSATVTTVNGLTASSVINVAVNDTLAPVVTAAFLDKDTQMPITAASSRDRVDIEADATDICDSAPVIDAMVGAGVSDADRLRVSRNGNRVSLNIDALDLSVHATDASNNSASAGSSLTIVE